MNERELALLKQRKQQLHAVLKENERLPKAKRDAVAVVDAKKKIATIDRWLKDKPAVEETQPPVTPKPAATTRQPEGVIKIDTIEQLQESFHDIKKKNVIINGPPEVQDALRLLMKQFVREEFSQHFRSEDGANVHFWGIDPNGDPWNCLLKMKSSKRGRIMSDLLVFTGYYSFDKWKSHGFKTYFKK